MLNQDYKEILSALLEEKAEFILVGAYALAVHGFPRATGDIDIFVCPSKENAHRVYKALKKFGAPMNQVTVDDFATPGIVFQIGVAPRRVDILTHIDGISFQSANEDKLTVEIEDLKIPVISKGKLIQNKESTGREKDKLDAKTLRGI